MRRFMLLLSLLLAPTVVLSQNSAQDSENLKSLLEEVRLLRRDMRTTMVAGQRVQIALYRLQLQDAALARASRAAEEAHAKLSELAANRNRITGQVEQAEHQLSSTDDASERKVMQEAIPQMKGALERLVTDEQQWQAKATDADTQVRTEQRKLDALHALLDQLDKALQNADREDVKTVTPK
jgi:hypothetical protein